MKSLKKSNALYVIWLFLLSLGTALYALYRIAYIEQSFVSFFQLTIATYGCGFSIYIFFKKNNVPVAQSNHRIKKALILSLIVLGILFLYLGFFGPDTKDFGSKIYDIFLGISSVFTGFLLLPKGETDS